MAALSLLGLAALVGFQAGTPDSAAVHRRARSAQADFERYRRAHLPVAGPTGGLHEERIGRFRFWHDDGQAPPPAELPRVRGARAHLLAQLDTAAAAVRGDGWVAGQLVRYLVEHDSTGRAVTVAQRCTAAAWWCLALEGLARHAGGDFAGAEMAFDRALEVMPPERRCAWTDASQLLEGDFRQRYRRLPCADREALNDRIWWLARPLSLLSGNDRRTEHLARMTMVELYRDARNGHGIPWGSDMAEIMVRYGWVTAWSQEPSRPGSMDDAAIVGHQRSPGFRFLPTPAALAEPFAAVAGDWDLKRIAPRDVYAPAYADSFVALSHQVAAFRRGDSTLVLAAYDLSIDPGFARGGVEVALELSGGPERETVIARRGTPRGALQATIGPGAVLVGLDAFSRAARRAARSRSALPVSAPIGVTISDLLLLEPADSLPRLLDQAVPLMLATTDLGSRRRVGVFWEVYGLSPGGELVEIAVAARRTGTGVLRRAAHALGLASPSDPVRIEWQESPRTLGRSLLLDLSALGPGRYRIELTVAAAQQDPITVWRDIRLGKASGERASRQ
ncbi:MAG TPA: hypothetical protein VGA20_01830 [Gemmatimonadales bacterium]